MSSGVGPLYKSVIDDVVTNVREAFLDEGVDEQILMELKQTWENKLMQSKAVPPEGMQQQESDHVLTQSYPLQTQQSQNTSNSMQSALKGATTMQQQIPAGSVVQPTVQYQFATADLREAPKTMTITLPHTVAPNQKSVAITFPATIMQQAPAGLVMSNPAAAAASALPPGIAAGLLQPSLAAFNTASVITQQNSDGTTVQYQALTAEQFAKQGFTLNMSQQGTPQQNTTQVQQVQIANNGGIIQLDGAHDTSDDDDDDDDLRDDDNDQDNDDEQNDDENDGAGEEEDPLNSGDDVSDEDPSELFDTDNVIVCQYDKITRSRNKWKFHLKDGIMNLQGKDFVFQRASGDAEW